MQTKIYKYRNFYKCSVCNREWTDAWDCCCNDRCPGCGTEIEPYKSEDIDNLTVAAIAYLKLKARKDHPGGKFDRAGRWYPDESLECCKKVRQPTRGYPYSLMQHCRSIKHIAILYGVEESAIRKLTNKRGLLLLLNTGDEWVNKYIEENIKLAEADDDVNPE